MKGFRVWFNLGVLSALAIGLANCSSAPSTFVTMPSATQSGPVPTQAKIPPELLVSPFPQRWDDTGVLIEGVLPSRKYGQYRLTNVWQSVVENGVQAIYAGESKEVDGRLSGQGIVLLNVYSADGSELLEDRRYETDRDTGMLKIVDVVEKRVVLLCSAGYAVTLDLETERFDYGVGAINEVKIENGTLTLYPNVLPDPNVDITTAWNESDGGNELDVVYVGTENSTQQGLVRAWASDVGKYVDHMTEQPTGWLTIFDVRGSVMLMSDQFGGIHGYSLAEGRYLDSSELEASLRAQPDHLLLPIP